MEVKMDTAHLVTAGELKKELKKVLRPDMQEIPSYYLAQIQVYYTEDVDSRVHNDANLNVDAAIEPVTSQVNAWHFPSHIGTEADAAIVPADHANVRHFPSRLGPDAHFVQVANHRANNGAHGSSSSQDPSFQGTYTEQWKSDLNMQAHIESTFAKSCFA